MDPLIKPFSPPPLAEYPAFAVVDELPSIVARQYRKGFALRTVVDPVFRVTVRGHKAPFDKQERIYHIEAKSDRDAAFEGISLFAGEMRDLVERQKRAL